MKNVPAAKVVTTLGALDSPLRGCARPTTSVSCRVASYGYFADRDPLTRAVMDRMLAGVSTRKFARVGEPVGSEVEQASSSTGKTTTSEMFIERTRTALGELMSRRLDDVRVGGDDARRPGDRRPHARRRARDHDRRPEDPARPVGGQHRERDPGPDASRRRSCSGSRR